MKLMTLFGQYMYILIRPIYIYEFIIVSVNSFYQWNTTHNTSTLRTKEIEGFNLSCVQNFSMLFRILKKLMYICYLRKICNA